MAQTAPVPTAVIVHTPELVQTPGQNAVLYAQVYDQYGDPMAGQTVQFDIRGSSDNNYQNVMTRYGGPSGDGGLVSMAYTRSSDSEDVILIRPTGALVAGVQTTAAATVTFHSSASPVTNVGQPAQRVYVANKNPQPLSTGQFAGFQVNVFDASNHPVNGTLVTFRVVGVNSYTTQGYTNSNGEVHFGYNGSNPGDDVVTATMAVGAPGGAVQTWVPSTIPDPPDACDIDPDCDIFGLIAAGPIPDSEPAILISPADLLAGIPGFAAACTVAGTCQDPKPTCARKRHRLKWVRTSDNKTVMWVETTLYWCWEDGEVYYETKDHGAGGDTYWISQHSVSIIWDGWLTGTGRICDSQSGCWATAAYGSWCMYQPYPGGLTQRSKVWAGVMGWSGGGSDGGGGYLRDTSSCTG